MVFYIQGMRGDMKDHKQAAILAHYLAGGSLTVFEAWSLFHTSELRRCNSRINNILRAEGKGREIKGEFETDQSYKRYRLITSAIFQHATGLPDDLQGLDSCKQEKMAEASYQEAFTRG